MITTAKATFRQKGSHCRGNIHTPDFDYFIVEEGAGNTAERRRYRMLLQYACTRCLSEKERQAVEWRYREGKSLSQVSRETGIPVSTLSRRVRVARGKLLAFAEQAAAVRRIIRSAEDHTLS